MHEGQVLASWAANARWRDLPNELREKVIDHVVDTIGVMYSGLTVEACVAAGRAAAMWGNAQDASVVGTRTVLPAANAAFLNALHGRVHTFDDTYEPGTMHAGSPVVAAALALAEKHARDGETFLSAVLAGHEVASRVASAVSPGHYASGFHNTGTCTVFGAAAGAARVLGLDANAMVETLGLAGATAAGLRQHQIDGSMLDSAFHGARAAQSGVMVAQLRAEGVQGPPAILEGPMGFCAVMAPARDVSRLTAALGTEYEFGKTTIKLYPTCRFAHGPIDAALTLKRKHGLDPSKIKSVLVETFRQSIEVSDRPELRTPFDAVVSHQYSVALALVNGKVELAAITDERMRDPAVLALMQKVRVMHDPVLETEFPRSWPHCVTVQMTDGAKFSLLSEYPPGRTAPIPRASVDEKFMTLSAPHIGETNSGKALELIRGLAHVDNLRMLTATLVS